MSVDGTKHIMDYEMERWCRRSLRAEKRKIIMVFSRTKRMRRVLARVAIWSVIASKQKYKLHDFILLNAEALFLYYGLSSVSGRHHSHARA